MTAERTPPPDHSFLSEPLAWVTRRLLRAPLAIVIAAVALAGASILVTYEGLGFHTSRLDLLNPDSGYNKLWIEYINEFGDEDDAVIVVEGDGRDSVAPVLRDLADTLQREDRLFHAVLHEVDLSKVRAKGLHYLPPQDLAEVEHYLRQIEPILRDDWSMLNLEKMIGGLYYRLETARAAGDVSAYSAAGRELARLMESLAEALGQRNYRSPWQEMNDSIATLSQIDSEYLLTNEGRLGFVLLRLGKDKGQFAQGTDAIDQLRRLIADARLRHPGVRIGLTGLPVMENDEMRASQADMTFASIISLFGVACLFIAGFGGIRHPLVTVAGLLIAMAWTFGYITLAVGHLNILSVSFSVILIGLGIDFGIHYVARYLQLRRTMPRPEDALAATARSVGPGIITGGVTTAFAFFATSLTEFTGIAELGVISGGGILLCIAGAIFVLPAILLLLDRGRLSRQMPEPLDAGSWLAPLCRFPRLVLAASLLATAGLCGGASMLWYDHNLLNLQPVGLESVELERKLLAESNQSVWYALSIAETREELLERKDRFLELASVERTEEIVSLLPLDHGEKRPTIERIARRLADLREHPPLIPLSPPENLGRGLALVQGQLLGDTPQRRATRRQIEQIRDMLRRMPPDEAHRRLSDYQQRMAGDLLSRLHVLRSIANPEPPELSDLPPGLVTRFVGKNNRYLLKIYSRGGIWDMDALERFVHDVKGVDPDATGNPIQTYFASRHMQQSFILAAGYALVAVTVLLALDFWSFLFTGPALRDAALCTLLAMMPMLLGAMQMFGIMGWLDIPLNPANMIVLPLILGIGIDDGVHVMHDFRRQTGRYRLSNSTAMAVIISSLTTMVGFGSLMLAGHQGLQSLGRVLTLGVTCCMINSLVILPAILVLLSRRRAESPPTAASCAAEQTPAAPAQPLGRMRGAPLRDDDLHALPPQRPHRAPAAPDPYPAHRERRSAPW